MPSADASVCEAVRVGPAKDRAGDWLARTIPYILGGHVDRAQYRLARIQLLLYRPADGVLDNKSRV